MVTLNDALAHKNTIIEFANDFGFEDVRVYCDSARSSLQLVVRPKPDVKNYRGPLEAFLIDRLNLQIIIVQENRLKSVYKVATLKQCAPIEDIEAIERLYLKKASEVIINPAPTDIESKNERVPLLDIANEILVTQKKIGYKPLKITFFSEAPESEEKTSSTNATNLKRKIDELTEEVDTDFVAVLQNIPLEVLDKVEKHAQEIKKSRLLDLEAQSARRLPIKGN